jgi:hypothetical protein
MTRSSPWAILLAAVCACNGGDDGNDNGGKPPELPGIEPVDADGDSVASDTDCNDGDAAIFPGATETVQRTRRQLRRRRRRRPDGDVLPRLGRRHVR